MQKFLEEGGVGVRRKGMKRLQVKGSEGLRGEV